MRRRIKWFVMSLTGLLVVGGIVIGVHQASAAACGQIEVIPESTGWAANPSPGAYNCILHEFSVCSGPAVTITLDTDGGPASEPSRWVLMPTRVPGNCVAWATVSTPGGGTAPATQMSGECSLNLYSSTTGLLGPTVPAIDVDCPGPLNDGFDVTSH